MAEIAREAIAVERDFCLANLVGQAEATQIDAEAGRYLVEQLNDAHTADVEAGSILECRVGGCALQCLVVNENGILQVIDEDGQQLCKE